MTNHIYVGVTPCYTVSSYYGLIFVEACNMLFNSPQYLHSYIAYIPPQLQYVIVIVIVIVIFKQGVCSVYLVFQW